jgi:hypothetical protein
MDIMFWFIIWVVAFLVVGIIIKCIGTKEHRNVLYGGREFEVYLSSECSGRMCEASVWEVIYPDRKLFRTKYRCYKTFWIDDYETIKEGVYSVITSYLIDEQEANLIEAKWKEVEEND